MPKTKKRTKLTPPLKWHGGKQYLARRIVELMPRHLHYVEPYAGGLAVLLERDPNDPKLWMPGHQGVSEVVNDINGELINFWRVLKYPEFFEGLQRRLRATPLARAEFETAQLVETPGIVSVDLAAAANFFIRCRQSRAGTFKGFTQLSRSRLRRGINGNASEWLGAIEGLPAVHARLQPVVIENLDALKVIHREDTEHTLFYLDPPYLHETRVTKDAYANEMTAEQHDALLTVLLQLKGKFMLSGYRSKMYDDAAAAGGWKRHEFDIANHAAGGKEKRRMTECVWCNF